MATERGTEIGSISAKLQATIGKIIFFDDQSEWPWPTGRGGIQ